MPWKVQLLFLIVVLVMYASASDLRAQVFGIELHNNLMPASGGMAGASLSQPQDVQSAINGNPATLRQFRGTQFSFGGAWADATYSVTQTAPLPLTGVTPFSASSATPGALLGNIGLTQDLDAFGVPATMGMGLMSNAGAGVNFLGVPASNGTTAQYLALDLVAGVSTHLTERLALGASAMVGTSYIDGPFADFGGMTAAYAFRGNIGLNYWIDADTALGVYWQSKKNMLFNDAVLLPGGNSADLAFDHPENIGIGLSRSSLMNGRLLLATDVLYKAHSEADFLRAIYNDQWCFQFGGQYAVNQRVSLRAGYAYNENPMKDAQLQSIGGVNLPDGVPALRYVQGQFASMTQHRLTCGLGVRDFQPGIDLDLFGGYAFDAQDQFATTTANIDGNFWVGFGTTWRFGGSCCNQCETVSNNY